MSNLIPSITATFERFNEQLAEVTRAFEAMAREMRFDGYYRRLTWSQKIRHRAMTLGGTDKWDALLVVLDLEG